MKTNITGRFYKHLNSPFTRENLIQASTPANKKKPLQKIHYQETNSTQRKNIPNIPLIQFAA